MKNWQWQLDASLPEPFRVIGEWVTKAEQLINDNHVPSVMNEETAVIISKKLENHKVCTSFLVFGRWEENVYGAGRFPILYFIGEEGQGV